jgi:adenylyltransferase/sulfurtransferase
LVDFDIVESSNLQRQVLHATSAVGKPKLASAAVRIADVNPHVALVHHEVHLTSQNALEILSGYDVILDGSDNFPTRYLVNDACALLGKPDVYGSIFRFDGQASVFWAARGPCYRCLYREPPPPELVPSCAEGGVLGVLPGIVGSIQALEAIKLVLGEGDSLVGRLLLFDALRLKFREMALEKDPDCPLCGAHPSIRGLIDYEAFCGVGPAAARSAAEQALEVRPKALRAELVAGRKIQLVDVREPFEWEICRIAGSVLIPLGELPARLADRPKKIIPVDDVEPHQPGLEAGEHRKDQARQKGDPVVAGEALRHGVSACVSAPGRREGSRSPVAHRRACGCEARRAASPGPRRCGAPASRRAAPVQAAIRNCAD